MHNIVKHKEHMAGRLLLMQMQNAEGARCQGISYHHKLPELILALQVWVFKAFPIQNNVVELSPNHDLKQWSNQSVVLSTNRGLFLHTQR